MYKSRNHIAIPPGETIREQLDNRGMSQKEFALMNGTTEKEEKDADIWAENAFFDRSSYDSFVSKKDYSETEITAFASRMGTASGIIVGRMQREGIIGCKAMNHLKEKYTILSSKSTDE